MIRISKSELARRTRLSKAGLSAHSAGNGLWDVCANGRRVLCGFVANDETDALQYAAVVRSEHPEWFMLPN